MLLPHFGQESLPYSALPEGRSRLSAVLMNSLSPRRAGSGGPTVPPLGSVLLSSGSLPHPKCVSVLELRIRTTTCRTRLMWKVDGLTGLHLAFSFWHVSKFILQPKQFGFFQPPANSSSLPHGWQHNFSHFYWKTTTKTNIVALSHFHSFNFYFWSNDELQWSLRPTQQHYWEDG